MKANPLAVGSTLVKMTGEFYLLFVLKSISEKMMTENSVST